MEAFRDTECDNCYDTISEGDQIFSVKNDAGTKIQVCSNCKKSLEVEE